jgi:transcriptional regulator with XRE-family HTH domain
MPLSKPKKLNGLDLSVHALNTGTVSPSPEQLIAELKAWVSEKRGRHAKVAQLLDVSTGNLSDWFNGRSLPSWETGRKIEAFLKRERRKKLNPRPPSDPDPC